MAFTSTIKPYKFVNPSSISVRGGGATIIAGGKTITGGMTSQVKSARVTVLAINRIGQAMEGLGKTQQQIRDIIVHENKYLAQSTAFKRRREQYRKDQKSEQQSESFGKKEQEGVAKEVQKKEKKKLGWLEKIFGPFAGIISFVGRFVITQTVLRWMGDPKNTDKLTTFVKSFSKVFKWAFNIAYKSTDAVLTGFAKVFGSSDKKGLNRFGEVLGGLGTLLIGIAGFKALGYLLNPFSLVNDIMGLLDAVSTGGGKSGPDVSGGKPEAAKSRAAVQKVAENYGDDAARYYDDLIKRGKKPGDALKAVRGRFKKIPPKPKGIFDKVGDAFGNIKKGLGKGFEKIKGFAGNITKGMRDKLVKSGEFLKSSTQKAMQPIAKKAYEFLESKGIIKLANNAGEKAVGIIKKMPGYGKIMSKVQKEGGEAVLKKLGAKSIPVIGGLVNLYFAYDRLKNGDRSGAALEAISAILDIAGLFTGGTTSALSMVLDTYLFGRDFFPDLVKSENAAFGKLINSILGPINSIKDSLPKIPFLRDGGIVTKPTRANLGEDGPEVVLPLNQLGSGGLGGQVATIIGATESALSRMGAAGEIARALINPELQSAMEEFGVTPVKGSGGDTLGKSVNKGSVAGGLQIDAGNDISILLGTDKVTITDKREPRNKPTTLRGQLANILSALIWVSTKNFAGGSGSGGPSPGPSGGGGGGMLPGDAPPIIKAMLDAIAAAEGGWDSVNPGTTVPGLSKMTIAEARRAAMAKGYGMGGSGAMGKWQQMPQFILGRAKSAGLDPNKDIFNEENQTKIARMLMAGVYPGGEKQLVADAQQSPLKAAANLRGTWPSLPGGSQENVHSKNFVKHFNENVSKYSKMAKGGEIPPGIKDRSTKQLKKSEENKLKILKGEMIGGLVKFANGGSFKNGQLPASELQDIGKGEKLRKGSVAESFLQMAAAAKRDNIDLISAITGSYRDLAGQEYMYATKPKGMAAKPGTSKHGWGIALDIGQTNAQNWINKKGSQFGWGLPDWAKGGFEPWHFEKLGASSAGTTTPSSNTQDSTSPSEPPETMESLMSKLKSAVSSLNTSLGYGSSPDSSAEQQGTSGRTPTVPNTSSTQKPKAAVASGTTSASSSGQQMASTSEQVARLEEAAANSNQPAQIIPLPINSGMTQIAYGGTEVYTPRTPITFGI